MNIENELLDKIKEAIVLNDTEFAISLIRDYGCNMIERGKKLSPVLRKNQDMETLEVKCKEVLKYLYPGYESEMNAGQYNNAMDALKSIGR
mgnify:CR=1 FL=1|tara:strand:+ start:258 stop:530 length:273 start_codon:yes stop_codon:yes gene_type:complete